MGIPPSLESSSSWAEIDLRELIIRDSSSFGVVSFVQTATNSQARISDRFPYHWVDVVCSVGDGVFAGLAAVGSPPAIMAGKN